MGQSPRPNQSLNVPEAYSVHGVIDTEPHGFDELEEQWCAEGVELENTSHEIVDL